MFEENTKDFFIHIQKAVGLTPYTIKIKLLTHDATIPTYAHDGDVGLDLKAISCEYDEEKDMYVYRTGISIETEKNYGVLVFPRSSNNKTDCYLCNSVGIIDTATYRGEIKLCFKSRTSTSERINNLSFQKYIEEISFGKSHETAIKEMNKVKDSIFKATQELKFAPYKVGDKIGQMVLVNIPQVKFQEVYDLSETERGDNGFGSSGN